VLKGTMIYINSGTSNGGRTAVASGTDPITIGTSAITFLLISDDVKVESFGAVCDGITDDTAAIQAAVNTGKQVLFPAKGRCRVTSPIVISIAGTRLQGAGMFSSVISSSVANGAVISISVNTTGVVIDGLQITRSVSPGGSAYGIAYAGYVDINTINACYISGHDIGASLSSTGFGTFSNNIITECAGNGVQLANTAAVGAMQWLLINNLAQTNGGSGFSVIANTGPFADTISLGDWRGNATYANTQYGMGFFGASNAKIAGVRISGGFVGQDGHGGIYLDTYGSQHVISGCFMELAGSVTTGPTYAQTPATSAGHGIQITANNFDVLVEDVLATGNSQSGLITAASLNTTIVGGQFINNTQYGCIIADGTKANVTGVRFYNNTSGSISVTSNATSLVAVGNLPDTVNRVQPVSLGGTGLSSGTTTGIPYFNNANTMASSGALASGQVMVGGGGGGAPATISNGQLPATATNDSAAAGKVGEYIESVIASGSAVSLVTATAKTVTSISLTAGDWDVSANCGFTGGATTQVTYMTASVSTTTNTLDQTNGRQNNIYSNAAAVFNATAGGLPALPIQSLRFSLSATTTIYLVAQTSFTTSTASAFGLLRARRVR
jgi:hypothetical protein